MKGGLNGQPGCSRSSSNSSSLEGEMRVGAGQAAGCASSLAKELGNEASGLANQRLAAAEASPLRLSTVDSSQPYSLLVGDFLSQLDSAASGLHPQRHELQGIGHLLEPRHSDFIILQADFNRNENPVQNSQEKVWAGLYDADTVRDVP
jgi:hypothetical protein